MSWINDNDEDDHDNNAFLKRLNSDVFAVKRLYYSKPSYFHEKV